MNGKRARVWHDRWADIRRSFLDFLAVPTATVLGFVLLALLVYLVDRQPLGWIEPTRRFLRDHFIDDAGKTEALLGTIAGGMITLTSITFSLLLLAVQQSAAALTTQVLDQFLHRRDNQVYFGVFVGVSIYALLILAANSTQVTPVFGASVALLLSLVALVVLVLLLYSTLNQMRPIRIVDAIHDLTLAARGRQEGLLARTLREATYDDAPLIERICTDDDGYVTQVRLQRLASVLDHTEARCEVSLLVSLGDYVCYRGEVAEVRGSVREDVDRLSDAARTAVNLERQRDLRHDASYGIDQLATIAWTSISTAKSNPAPALAALRNLRDLSARWSAPEPTPPTEKLQIVYRDTLLQDLVATFESMAVVSSESMQHQSCAEVLRSFADLLRWMPSDLQPRLDDAIRRILPALGDHVLTADLDAALTTLVETLDAVGRHDTAHLVRRARDQMAELIGTFAGRASRVAPRSS